MELKDIRKKEIESLLKEIKKLKKEYVDLKLTGSIKKTKDTSIYRKKRQLIARINTIIREKEILKNE